MGQLADKPILPGKIIQGLLVQQTRNDLIVDPDSLPAFTRLQRGSVLQRQAVPLQAPFAEVSLAILAELGASDVAGNIKYEGDQSSKQTNVHQC